MLSRLGLFVTLCAFLLAGSLTCCGSRRVTPSTDLTLLAVNPSVGRAAFHLACGPAGGDLRNPVRACAALAAQPELVTNPKPFTCIGGTFSWWDITITGRLHGRPVRTVQARRHHRDLLVFRRSAHAEQAAACAVAAVAA